MVQWLEHWPAQGNFERQKAIAMKHHKTFPFVLSSFIIATKNTMQYIKKTPTTLHLGKIQAASIKCTIITNTIKASSPQFLSLYLNNSFTLVRFQVGIISLFISECQNFQHSSYEIRLTMTRSKVHLVLSYTT